MPAETLLCHRCGSPLTPGAGDFYQIRIEAVADPSPPTIDADDLQGDLADRIAPLLEAMDDRSAQELLDQVYRRLVIHLCGPCYRKWIEDPTGSLDRA